MKNPKKTASITIIIFLPIIVIIIYLQSGKETNKDVIKTAQEKLSNKPLVISDNESDMVIIPSGILKFGDYNGY